MTHPAKHIFFPHTWLKNIFLENLGINFETNNREEIEKFERQIKAAIESRESIIGMLKNSAIKFREARENEFNNQVNRENSMKENIQKLKSQLR